MHQSQDDSSEMKSKVYNYYLRTDTMRPTVFSFMIFKIIINNFSIIGVQFVSWIDDCRRFTLLVYRYEGHAVV
jgi:hypothetical protein